MQEHTHVYAHTNRIVNQCCSCHCFVNICVPDLEVVPAIFSYYCIASSVVWRSGLVSEILHRLLLNCITQMYFSVFPKCISHLLWVVERSSCMSQILDCCQTGPNHIPLLQCTLKQFGKIFQYLKRKYIAGFDILNILLCVVAQQKDISLPRGSFSFQLRRL